MSETILYGEKHWDSPWVFTAFVGLREKNIPFVVQTLDLDAGDQREATFRDGSLTSRVPTLRHGDFWLSESTAIVEYLDDVFPAPEHARLLPWESRERARARQVLGWLRTDLLGLRRERSTATMFFGKPTAPLSPEALADAEKLTRVALAVVPPGRSNIGTEWSVADADLAFALHRLLLNGHEFPSRIRDYASAHWARPSVQEFVHHARVAHEA